MPALSELRDQLGLRSRPLGAAVCAAGLVVAFVPRSCRWISSRLGGEQILDAAAEVPSEPPRVRDGDRPVVLAPDVADAGLRQVDLDRGGRLRDSRERHRAGHRIGAGI